MKKEDEKKCRKYESKLAGIECALKEMCNLNAKWNNNKEFRIQSDKDGKEDDEYKDIIQIEDWLLKDPPRTQNLKVRQF